MRKHYLAAGLTGLLLLFGNIVSAATIQFDGSAVPGCNYSAATSAYTCSPLTADTVSVVIGFSVTADITAYSIDAGASTTLTGNLVSGSVINIGVSGIVKGNLTAVATINVGATAVVTGNLSAGADVNVGANALVYGIVNAGASVSVGANGLVQGSVTSLTTVDVGAAGIVLGNVTAATTVAVGAKGYVVGNVVGGTTVAVGANGYVIGSVSGGTTVAVGADGYIECDPVAGSVKAGTTFAVGAGGHVICDVSSVGTLALGANAYVIGSVNGQGGVALGAGGYVTGNLTSGLTTALGANSHVSGNAYSTGGIDLGVSAYIGGTVVSAFNVTVGAAAYSCGEITAPTVTLGAAGFAASTINANSTVLGANAFIIGNLNSPLVTLGAAAYVNGTITGAAAMGAGACYGALVPGPSDPSLICALPRPANVSQSLCIAATPVAPVALLDHILITHNGSALTCAPQAVKLTACANPSCSSLYTGGVTVTLLPGGQVFTIDTSGANAAAAIRQTAAATITLAATSIPAAPVACLNSVTGAASCLMGVADAGFLFSVPNHHAETTQIVNVSAVQTGTNLKCVPAFASVAKTVSLSCAYVNPSSGTLPVRIGGIALAANASASCSSAGNKFTLNFDANGNAPVSLAYADVGQVSLSAALVPTGADSGLVLKGISNFIATPAGFGFSQMHQTNGAQLLNPAPSDASGASFVQAGAPFSMTLTALNAVGAPTPNFGNEQSPETVSMLLPTLVLPIGGATPPVLGTVSAFINGAASSTNLVWNEAGIIALNLKVANPYGYLGLSGAANVVDTTSTSGNVGRFIPAYFNTAISSGVPMPCPTSLAGQCALPLNAFVYSRQPFAVSVSALNLSGGVTSNYSTASGLARTVSMTAWSASGSTVLANPPVSDAGKNALTMLTPLVFTQGVGASATLAYNFFAAYPSKLNLAGPTNIYLRAIDTDAVSSLRSLGSSEGGLTVVIGRLQTGNYYGSEVLPTWISTTAQYWNGARYLNSTTDSASGYASTDVLFSNCQKNLLATQGCITGLAVGAVSKSVVLTSGVGRFRLNPVGAGKNGSVDVSLGAPLYLPATTARIAYGLFKSQLIDLRETYRGF